MTSLTHFCVICPMRRWMTRLPLFTCKSRLYVVKIGYYIYLSKCASASRRLPSVGPSLAGMHVIDSCLPFDLCSAMKIFNTTADALE